MDNGFGDEWLEFAADLMEPGGVDLARRGVPGGTTSVNSDQCGTESLATGGLGRPVGEVLNALRAVREADVDLPEQFGGGRLAVTVVREGLDEHPRRDVAVQGGVADDCPVVEVVRVLTAVGQ